MPRIRTIKPEFFTSEQVAECSATARLLFIGMWVFCDDGGVHPASLSRLKMEIFPADPITVDDLKMLIKELTDRGLIESYAVEGKEFWHVTGWHHQRIDKPNFFYPRSQEFYEQSESIRRGLHDRSSTESKGVERSRVESKGNESNGEVCGVPAPPTAPPASSKEDGGVKIDPESCEFPVFPCVAGKKTQSQIWELEQPYVAELQTAFPGVDVAQQCIKAHVWVKGNLENRKTAKGMREFLFNWMNREQNSGRGNRNGSSKAATTKNQPVRTF